ncbi:MAG: helix-turn-helix transcriptional regulator [Rhodocyclaceae bacterium]|nr:helix-turn-helix transcriptional regulator [Rhodocyclaceae bacterium]
MGFEREDIAVRLAEERTRVGYSQVAFARELGISREGLRQYETGQSGISGEFLAKAASLGVDVQYVLTGIRSANAPEAERALRPSVHVTGSGTANVVQFAQPGSTVNINHNPRVVNRTVVEVAHGDGHISDEQAATLTRLVNEIVELEKQLKKKPGSFRSVWGSVNAHCGVTQYRLIPAETFGKAENYLRQWIGRLNSMASAPVADNDTWRKRKYAYIKINTKDDAAWLTAYLKKAFHTESIADLSDDDLDRTYRAVATRKRDRARRAP